MKTRKQAHSVLSCAMTVFMAIGIALAALLFIPVISMFRHRPPLSQPIDLQSSIDTSVTVPCPIDYSYLNLGAMKCSSSDGTEMYDYICGNYPKSHSFFEAIDQANRHRVSEMKRLIEGDFDHFKTVCHCQACENMYLFYQKCLQTSSAQLQNDIYMTSEKVKREFDTNTNKNDAVDQISYLLINGLFSPIVIRVDTVNNKYVINAMIARSILFDSTLMGINIRGHEVDHRKKTTKLYNLSPELRNVISRLTSNITIKPLTLDTIYQEEVILSDAHVLTVDTIISMLIDMYPEARQRLMHRLIQDSFHKTIKSGDCWENTSHMFPASMCMYFKHVDHGEHDEEKYRMGIFNNMVANIKAKLYARYSGSKSKLESITYLFDDCSSLFSSRPSHRAAVYTETYNMGKYMHMSIPDMVKQIYSNHTYNLFHNALEMVSSMQLFNYEDNTPKHPVDWISQVDAWYDPYHKKIVFPPGIATTPMFTPLFAEHAIYGMLGFIVGHESAHAIDQYIDPLDKEYITRKFGEYDPFASRRLSENIADYVGLSTVLDIVQTRSNTAEFCKTILAFGQLWCNKNGVDLDMGADVHSSLTNRLRVPLNAIFQKNPEWKRKCFCKQ
jgi:hypothetical protein